MKGFLLWLFLALIWSASYGAIKIGLQGFGPMTLVAGRMCLAAVLLTGLLRLRGQKLPRDRRSLTAFLVSGVMGSALPFLLISYGEAHVDSGLAAVTMGIAPVATVMLAPLILSDERLNAMAVIGCAFGVAGLTVLVGGSALSGIGAHVWGQLAVFIAALCYAATTLYVRRYVKVVALQMATGATLVGAVIITLCAFVFEAPLSMSQPPMPSVLALLYLGVMATATANMLYFYLVPRLGAGRMAQINFLVPVFGAIIGVTVMNEPFEMRIVISLLMILTAVGLVLRSQH